MLCPEEHLDSRISAPWLISIINIFNQKYIDDLNIFIMRCRWQNKRRRYLSLLGSAGNTEVVETGVLERNPHQGCSFPVASTNLLVSSNSGFTSKLVDDRCWWIIQITHTFPGDLYAAVCICRGSPSDHIHTGLRKPLFNRNSLPHLPGAGRANRANS